MKGFWAIVAVVVVLAIACVGFSAYTKFNDTEYVATVTDKERIVEGVGQNSSSKYLVFCETKDGNVLVFENTDELLRGKFNSSTIQGTLKEGETYRFNVVGFRVPFLSMYQNIISVEPI